MPRANTAANKETVKKADQVMENQLDIPDFNFGQPVKEQPEVNVQVVFEKGGISNKKMNTDESIKTTIEEDMADVPNEFFDAEYQEQPGEDPVTGEIKE